MFKRDKIANLAIAVIIALLPLYTRISYMDAQRVSKDNVLCLFFISLCALMGDKKRSLPVYFWPVFAFCSLFVAFNVWEPLSIIVFYQSAMVISGLAFFARFYECYDEYSLNWILNGMGIGCLIQVFLGVFEYQDIEIYKKFVALFASFKPLAQRTPAYEGVVGSLGNTNLFSAYIGITGLSFLRRGWFYCLPFAVLGLCQAQAWGGVIAFIGGVLYFYWLKLRLNPKLPFGLALLSFLGAYKLGLGSLDSERFDVWRKSMAIVDKSHFLIGKGAGWYYDVSNTFVRANSGKVARQEHSEFLAWFNIVGIIGVLLLALFIYKSIENNSRYKIYGAIFFAGFCNCFMHFTFHQSTTAIVVIIAGAVYLSGIQDGVYMDRS